MDHQWSAERTGSDNECAPQWVDGLFGNETSDFWSEYPSLESIIFDPVSTPDDTQSMSGSDDQHFARNDNIPPTFTIGPSSSQITGASSTPSTFVTQPTQHQNSPTVQHTWTQNRNITPSKDLYRHVVEVSNDGVRSFFCGWLGCKHPVGFETKSRLVTHIRTVHLQEKPFFCLTCQATFTRRQDANRHSLSLNRGKQYKCSACFKAFSRKHYRDNHEERCLTQRSSQHSPTAR